PSDDKEVCKNITENYGDNPRVHRNTLIFLCAKSSARGSFDDSLRKKIAWEAIQKDESLTLTESQKREVKEKIDSLSREVKKRIRELYRTLYLPQKEGFEEIDMGMPEVGAPTSLDVEIFEKLDGEKIATRIDPSFLLERYIKGRDYVYVKSLLDSFYNTPGNLMITSDDVLKKCIREGVAEGKFGYGILEGEKPVCKYFKSDFTPEITDDSILIRPELCATGGEEDLQGFIRVIKEASTLDELEKAKMRIPWDKLTQEQKSALEDEISEKSQKIRGERGYRSIHLVLRAPPGKLSNIVRTVNYLSQKFKVVNVRVDISAMEGNIRPEEYEEKIKEAIAQSQMEVEKEEIG
ncbi:MAG: hypothetical protein ACK4SY_09555, partial [Pyrobaculum sp.]